MSTITLTLPNWFLWLVLVLGIISLTATITSIWVRWQEWKLRR